MKRRNSLALVLGSLVCSKAVAQSDAKPAATAAAAKPAPPARQEPGLVQRFVAAGHMDDNLPKVKEMLAADPKLVYAAWDWGGGDWETALGAASHVGSRDMARYLLSQGARRDSFCAAMLGERKLLAALLEADPTVAMVKGPHGFSLLYHVSISGDVAAAKLVKPALRTDAAEGKAMFSQALLPAVREGHLEMTRWLFENGEVNPNVTDGKGVPMLTVARRNGYKEVAAELVKHGAQESQ